MAAYTTVINRRLVIDEKGQRTNIHKCQQKDREEDGVWQRCLLRIEGDEVKIWRVGGTDREDLRALEEIAADINHPPIDHFWLRMVHVQVDDSSSDEDSELAACRWICFHFTKKMQRILIAPAWDDCCDQGKKIDFWRGIFQRALHEAINEDQITTGQVISGVAAARPSMTSSSYFVEMGWPGAIDLSQQPSKGWIRCQLSIGRSSPKDSGMRAMRLASRRCVTFFTSPARRLAQITNVLGVHLFQLTNSNNALLIEGQARSLRSNPNICPLSNRILVRPLQADEVGSLLLLLRDTFELIFPKPISTHSDEDLALQRIQVSSVSSFDSVLVSLKPKPWSQVPWTRVYELFLKINGCNGDGNDDGTARGLTKYLKARGYCLRSHSSGKVIRDADLMAMKEIKWDDFYWNHISLLDKCETVMDAEAGL